MNTNRNGASNNVNTMIHASIDKLLARVRAAGHEPKDIKVMLRHNRDGLPHAHATASVRVIFDEVVTMDEATNNGRMTHPVAIE